MTPQTLKRANEIKERLVQIEDILKGDDRLVIGKPEESYGSMLRCGYKTYYISKELQNEIKRILSEEKTQLQEEFLNL